MAAPPAPTRVRQLRLVVEAPDFDQAVAFYRDALGLAEQAAFEGSGAARVVILDAGRATLELANPAQKVMIDEVEVGRQVAPRLRVAFEVDDAVAVTGALVAAGASELAPPTPTPWRSLNARLDAPAGLQVTVFEELGVEAPDVEAAAALVDRVVDLAVDTARAGRLPFAAAIVRDGEVVATGVNDALVTGDPTSHAEVEAVRAASRQLGTADLSGTVLVTSCEPCAMCLTSAINAGIGSVLFAAPASLVPDLGGDARPLMGELQAVLRRQVGALVRHVPTGRAAEPFDAYLRTAGTGR